jgi:hypothetical protein
MILPEHLVTSYRVREHAQCGTSDANVCLSSFVSDAESSRLRG